MVLNYEIYYIIFPKYMNNFMKGFLNYDLESEFRNLFY